MIEKEALDELEPAEMVEIPAVVEFIAQDFSNACDQIPRGWKTICVLGFPEAIPQIVLEMPVVQGWYESPADTHLCICRKEFYVA